MRVAVRHVDEGHPNHGWFAYEQGRILGFTHPITGESYTPEHVRDALLDRARSQFPEADGYEHRVETLHAAGADEDGQEVSEWHPVGASGLPALGGGETVNQELTSSQDQQETSNDA